MDYGFNLLKAIFSIADEEVEKAELAVYSGMAILSEFYPTKKQKPTKSLSTNK